MKLALEDLTKAELIKLVKRSFSHQPTQRDLLRLRWESLSEEANHILAKASEEGHKYAGSNITKWNAAQKEFNRGLALADKADKVYEELSCLNLQ